MKNLSSFDSIGNHLSCHPLYCKSIQEVSFLVSVLGLVDLWLHDKLVVCGVPFMKLFWLLRSGDEVTGCVLGLC